MHHAVTRFLLKNQLTSLPLVSLCHVGLVRVSTGLEMQGRRLARWLAGLAFSRHGSSRLWLTGSFAVDADAGRRRVET